MQAAANGGTPGMIVQPLAAEVPSGSATSIVWSTVISPWTRPGPVGFSESKFGSVLIYFNWVVLYLFASSVTAGQFAGARSLPLSVFLVS
jgi:hypothetical protein